MGTEAQVEPTFRAKSERGLRDQQTLQRSDQNSTWIRKDVTRAVGMVPIVGIHRIHPICSSRLCYIKLESCNPGGSIKEKNAVYLIDQAEAMGTLQAGSVIVESSSGNFGIGLAMVGAARGYRVIIVVDAKTPAPMRRMLLAYGAELVDVPLTEADAGGSMQKARMKRAQELANRIPNSWYPCQHLNPLNPNAHAVYTAHEVENAFGDSLDALIVGVSTAGQIMGLANYLKPRYQNLKIIGVDVVGSVIMGTPARPYKMTGVGLSFVPPNLKYEVMEAAYVVSEQISYSVCHALSHQEGLLLGASTGAIVAAGLHVASTLKPKSRILMINPDRGDRYLETVYNAEWLAKNEFTLLDGAELNSALLNLKPISF
jgi:cysteine synthase A